MWLVSRAAMWGRSVTKSVRLRPQKRNPTHVWAACRAYNVSAYTVAGPAVALASRLRGVAGAGGRGPGMRLRDRTLRPAASPSAAVGHARASSVRPVTHIRPGTAAIARVSNPVTPPPPSPAPPRLGRVAPGRLLLHPAQKASPSSLRPLSPLPRHRKCSSENIHPDAYPTTPSHPFACPPSHDRYVPPILRGRSTLPFTRPHTPPRPHTVIPEFLASRFPYVPVTVRRSYSPCLARKWTHACPTPEVFARVSDVEHGRGYFKNFHPCRHL